MYQKINKDNQKRDIMKSMVGLMQGLEKLAPHPDRPGYRGALFTSLPGWCKTPGEHDGLAGMMVLDGMLGAAFTQASTSSTPLTSSASDSVNMANLATSALNAYEIYKSETDSERQSAAAHGRGTLARMSGVSISGSFNLRSSLSSPMQDFLDDMPERLKIEGQLANYLKKLKALDVPVYEPAFRYAA